MKNEIITKNPQSVEVEKIQTYLETMNLSTNLTKSEVKQFIEISQAFGLNPFKREIYATKFGDKFSIIVGFETYLKRAERSGLLSGWQVTTDGAVNFQNVGNSNITATITIFRKDWKQPFIHSVHFAEYCQKNARGEVNKMWREKPITMIKKVAMAQGFRLCFSDENGGLPYTSDEIGSEIQTDAIVMESNIVETPSVKPEVKKGRPKKSTEFQPVVDAIRGDDAIIYDQINKATTVKELVDLYQANEHIKTNKEIIELLSKRKNYILKTGLICECLFEDEIWDLIENETDHDILQFAKDKIDSLKTDNETVSTENQPKINDNELF